MNLCVNEDWCHLFFPFVLLLLFITVSKGLVNFNTPMMWRRNRKEEYNFPRTQDSDVNKKVEESPYSLSPWGNSNSVTPPLPLRLWLITHNLKCGLDVEGRAAENKDQCSNLAPHQEPAFLHRESRRGKRSRAPREITLFKLENYMHKPREDI